MMRKLLMFLFLAAVATKHLSKIEAYVHNPTASGATIHWNLTNPASPIMKNGRVVYNLNPAGSRDVPFAQVESAIAASFKTWEDLPNCAMAFTRGENRTETGAANDGIYQIYWRENSNVDDGLDLTGALAVTRLTTYVGGGRDGEIADVSLVFNGNQYQWATDGNPSRVDIAEVATHEIGHTFGMGHSPVGVSTMFPRTGTGTLQHRTLCSDDIIGASALYPSANFAGETGVLRGSLRDSSGNALFGGLLVVNDLNGNVIATGISQRDGNYRIAGLPPGDYTVFAQPINPSGGLYFSRDDMSSFYASSSTDFLTTPDAPVNIRAGGETAKDIAATRGTPAMQAYLVYNPATSSLSNIGIAVERGQTVKVAVGGPGLPTSGSAPLNISGTGVSLSNFRFAALSGTNYNAVVADATISANAAPGVRNMIVTANGQRAIAIGALEIIGTATQPPGLVNFVSAANFAPKVAGESIVSAFGANLAQGRASATTPPLPTTLDGTTVRLRDNVGMTRDAPLFFVSPTQVNYQIPPGLQFGPVSVTVTTGTGVTSTGNLTLDRVAPGLFAATGNGSGPAAAAVLRVKANGAQSYETVARFDTAANKFVTVPIDLSVAGDQVFLILFGTGIRFRSSLGAVNVSVGGLNQQVTFADKQGGQVGLDQINVRLSGLAGRGEVDVVTTVEGIASNPVRVNIR